MTFPWPPSRFEFPDPEATADADGLVAIGGDLEPATVLAAYRRGIFPWFNPGDPILWWSPDPRCLIHPAQFHPSKTLLRRARKDEYRLSCNRAFAEVIRHCAGPRSYADGTWITTEIQRAYIALHHAGVAHSIEVWEGETLVGGLYGLQLGRGFFGESMFSHRSDVSKLAFWLLMLLARGCEFPWVDCQLPNDHLQSLGAITLPRREFLQQLEPVLAARAPDWTALQHIWLSSAQLPQIMAAAQPFAAILKLGTAGR